MIQRMNGTFVPEVPRKPASGISHGLRSCSTRYRFGLALMGGSILYFVFHAKVGATVFVAVILLFRFLPKFPGRVDSTKLPVA
jgi:hypothetical protein